MCFDNSNLEYILVSSLDREVFDRPSIAGAFLQTAR